MKNVITGNCKTANSTIFELIMDDFPDIIHSVDEEGNILITNRAAEELLGYSRSELLSMALNAGSAL